MITVFSILDEIFTVDEARRTKPVNYYKLKDHEGEPIHGRVYEPELVKTRLDEDTTYRIEKILRERTRRGVKEMEVKFFGYPKHYWIKKTDIVN
jgi:hypothetical protein